MHYLVSILDFVQEFLVEDNMYRKMIFNDYPVLINATLRLTENLLLSGATWKGCVTTTFCSIHLIMNFVVQKNQGVRCIRQIRPFKYLPLASM